MTSETNDVQFEDDAWLKGLAGRKASANQPRDAAHLEGALLREAMLRWAPEVIPVAADDPARVQRLLERARKEGVLPPVPTKAIAAPSFFDRFRAWWNEGGGSAHRYQAMAAVFAVAVVAGIVFQTTSPPPEQGVVRHAGDSVVVLTGDDPAALRQEITTALAAAGVAAHPYTSLGRLGIDADFPSDPSPALLATLARYGIARPTRGVLQIEIEAGRR